MGALPVCHVTSLKLLLRHALVGVEASLVPTKYFHVERKGNTSAEWSCPPQASRSASSAPHFILFCTLSIPFGPPCASAIRSGVFQRRWQTDKQITTPRDE